MGQEGAVDAIDDTTTTAEIVQPGADSLFAKLPQEIVDSFTPEQRAALWAVDHAPTWRRYPVNLRFSLPFLSGRYFLTVVAGRDRRSHERLSRERRVHPWATPANLAFVLLTGTFFYVIAAGLILFASALVE